MSASQRIHLMGIAGTGMGAFAGLLKQAGYDVSGSDENVYPPMSDKLAEWGITARTPYGANNLEPAPDLVVVGNVIRRDNVEAVAMREGNLKHASFPHTLGDLFLKKRHSVVVAGTHGKTTTTSLVAHVLMHAGRDPGLLVGGIPHGLGESFRVGRDHPDAPFVVEGDEYDTAYFDKGPKFLHYHPRTLLCTSLEYDHADIYQNVEAIEARFAELMSLVPPADKGGHIVLCSEERRLWRARDAAHVRARITSYGDDGTVRANDAVEDERGWRFEVIVNDIAAGFCELPMSGRHNLLNALGAYAVLQGLGLSHNEIAAGLASFAGVKRRMEVRGEVNGVTVVDDFAHHPTAVHTTLAGARKRYPGRPLWALFEPRSATSCRKIFQDDYARAFSSADAVWLAPPGRSLEPELALDVPLLAASLRAQGKQATTTTTIDDMVQQVLAHVPPKAVLLCMSNGGFGNIHQRLMDGLGARR
jgi:UDP-N-acetylmuramate: L-alanyl-gamma-D-glutamyl-meso-diaminopimelate ligase